MGRHLPHLGLATRDIPPTLNPRMPSTLVTGGENRLTTQPQHCKIITGGHGRQKIQYINHVLRSSLIKSVDFFNFKNKLPYGQRTYADTVAVALRKG